MRHHPFLSYFVPLFAILVYVFVYDQVYIWSEKSDVALNFFAIASGAGAIFLGYLSDSYCRRRIFLAIHILTPILLSVVYLYPSSTFLIGLLGLCYNPLSTIRANIVDNLGESSKIHLISLSFVLQFLPDSLYITYFDLSRVSSFLWSMVGLGLILLIGLFFFFDRRDERIKKESMTTKLAVFLPETGGRARLTFMAFFFTQVAYLIGENVFTGAPLENFYESLFAFAGMLGAAFSALYRRIPHISVLTVGYGISLLVSLLPLGIVHVYGYHSFNLPYMSILLGALLGFFYAFVYDVVLRAAKRHYRGTVCGLLDCLFAGAFLMTYDISRNIYNNFSTVMFLIAGSFCIALVLQKLAESRA